ncbi:MAG: hypothetical protein V1797_04095 [Pseudomonadota bacterium]
MSSRPSEIEDHRPQADFDPGAELLDCIVDDIINQGAPCMDHLQQLIDKACHQPPTSRTEPDPAE